jgi:hypothetical protein
MSQNNLLHLHLANLTGYPVSHYPANRCTGLSTGIALKALGDAMRNPGVQIYAMDHATTASNKRPDDRTLSLAKDIVGKLGLVGFTFGKSHLGHHVTYDLYPEAPKRETARAVETFKYVNDQVAKEFGRDKK